MRTTVAIAVTVAVITGAAGFFGGITYQKSKQPNLQPGAFTRMRDGTGIPMGGQPANTIQRGVGFAGGVIMGEVMSRDENSITVKMRDGSSKIVILAASTKYTKSEETTGDEVNEGKNVMILGTANTDGSVTATSVQLDPEMRNLPVIQQ